ncbi:MAG: hypothetical protein ACTHNU_14040, partial [Gaiellales bacterium]
MERVGVVVTDTHVKPAELDAAITRVADTRRPLSIEVVIPVELPPTLPISAVPPRIAARADALLVRARAALEAARCPARAEIVACRSVGALLRDLPPLERLILVGATAWSVRRAARGVA